MTLVKNVEPYAIDVGGRALAPGEGPVDLDADVPAVAEQIELGHLVPCALTFPPATAPPAAPARTAAAPAEES